MSYRSTYQYNEEFNETEDTIEYMQNWTFINESLIDCNLLPPNSVMSRTWFQSLVYFFYMTIFVIAFFGNALVCYIVYRSPRMKTVTNYFIVNLAVGDILMDLFCVPTSFVSTLLLQYWPFGAELCPSVNYSQAVSVLVSAYTLVVISVDRYTAIMWPLKPRMSKKQAKTSIAVVWALALSFSSPIPYFSRLQQPTETYKYCDLYVCQETWPTPTYRYYYSIFLMFAQYIVPLAILIFTYTSIGVMVCFKRPPGEAENSRDQRMAKSKVKMIKMMITVVLVFTMCWLPFNVLIVVMDHDTKLNHWLGLPYLWASFHWLAMSHSCYNPVIYCWMNQRFRNGFLAVLHRLPMIRRITPDQNNAYNTSVAGIALTGITTSGGHTAMEKS